MAEWHIILFVVDEISRKNEKKTFLAIYFPFVLLYLLMNIMIMMMTN